MCVEESAGHTKVAFMRPPAPGPIESLMISVASPMRPANGTIPSVAQMNCAEGDASARRKMNAIGTKISSKFR